VSNQFNMSQMKFTTASYAMIAGGVAMLVGYFLPWASKGILSVDGSYGGWKLSILVLLAAIAAGGAGAAFAYMKPRFNMAWMVAVAAGAVALIVLLLNWSVFSDASIGIGFMLTAVGALVALGGGYLGYMEAKGTPRM
jgi:hypothetical protein